MTWDALATSALTAVLTLTGGLVLLRFQAISRAAEERRAARRQWHDEAVDVIVDVASFILDAGLLALDLPTQEDWTELQERWRATLRRRLQRVARGHPDPRMRAEADRLGEAAVRALRIAMKAKGHRHKYHVDDEIGRINDVLEIFDGQLIPIARSYVRCLHGEDSKAGEDSVSTLRRIYEIYRETGVLLKPGELSP